MATQPQVVPREIVSRNPATGEVLGRFDCATTADVRAAVLTAQSAQPAWRDLGVRERVRVVRNFQRLLYNRKREMSQLITRECGKPCVEALLTEVVVVLDCCRFLADAAPDLLRPERVPHGNLAMKTKSGALLREPYGVVGVISPWNYPFSIPASESLAALVAGNAVVLKPSELTPLVALELRDLLLEAGVPQGVFRVVVGDGSTGAALVEAPLDKIIFTGSVATGRRVAQIAAARLLPVVLELGGKDPMLVLDDADLDVASSAAVWGAFVNAGQTCLSVERCYVQRSHYEKFLELCMGKTQQLRVGDGLRSSTEVGPLISERQLQIVEDHVEDARLRGARILTGGMRLRDLGPSFYAPTVLANVDHGMQIMREETFGPVLPVMAFDRDEDALRLANDSEFGLAASIFTADRLRGEALAEQIQAGSVMINDAVSAYGIAEAPHGGVKSSGLGRTHGRLGLEEMVRSKYVDADLLPNSRKVWWYGYGEHFSAQMDGFVDFLFARSPFRRLRGGLKAAAAFLRDGQI
jgi:succinate-semialdehyde dehydrogenase/glutarate-semialdehyde dehydrogenase